MYIYIYREVPVAGLETKIHGPI